MYNVIQRFGLLTLLAIASASSFSTISRADNALLCIGIDKDAPSISGVYLDNFAGFHSVGKEAWVSALADSQLVFHVCSVDNTKNFLIAQNSPGNDYNPSKFSRFEWYGSNGQLFYCQQVFDAASAADAADFSAHPAADSSDANDKGCGQTGQFAWSQLSLIRR